MIRLLFTLLLIGSLAAPLQAQGKLGKVVRLNATSKAVQRTLPASQEVSRALENRIIGTLQKINTYPDDLFSEPIIAKIYDAGSLLRSKKIYPDNPLLTNQKQVKLYFIARNNRQVLREIRRMPTFRARLQKALPVLKKQASQLRQPTEQVSWLLENIPVQTKQLFIGEKHEEPLILSTISKLIVQLKQKYPNREIILFTEFLPSSFKRIPTTPHPADPYFPMLDPYDLVWETALRNNIPVIGLENPEIFLDFSKTKDILTDAEVDLWATLEGGRIRNEYWIQILKKYREQHPDALFIIYTGAWHCYYNQFFSLPHAFEQETSWVVELLPDSKGMRLLESLTNEAVFSKPALKWDSRELGNITGFDISLKVRPEN